MAEVEGDELSFTWNIEPADISEGLEVAFILTAERNYHRSGSFDAYAYFGYSVLPL